MNPNFNLFTGSVGFILAERTGFEPAIPFGIPAFQASTFDRSDISTQPLKYYNRYRKQADSMLPKLHAEISCMNQIKHLDINFSKVKLYVYRIRKDQPFGLSRPCPSCMEAIKDLGIRDIYYTTNDGFSYERLEKNNVGGII